MGNQAQKIGSQAFTFTPGVWVVRNGSLVSAETKQPIVNTPANLQVQAAAPAMFGCLVQITEAYKNGGLTDELINQAKEVISEANLT